ncbi:MAG: hypothetical protein JWR07_4897 [Nevskia sp.]|nr:hypothetical protein [Nevskia sp.]
MVSEWDSKVPKRPRTLAFRASTVLLLFALPGLLLHLTGAEATLKRLSEGAAWALVSMAPLWALIGFLSATIYLMLSISRPYNAAQHLVEMVVAAAVIVLLRPVF